MQKLFTKQQFFSFFIALWLKTLRVDVDFPKDFRAGVLGIWHADLPAATAAFRNTGLFAMISESRDGELMARVARFLNYRVVRGSSTHGAGAIRKLLDPLKNGQFVAMALDGPKGPARVAKPGSAWLAQKSGVPFWLVKVDYSLKISLHSWDKTKIPLPFSKIVIHVNYFSCQKTTKPATTK